jgi:stage V sporulation protein D (sporulation-specific penicillin-binding protein)
MNKKSNKFKKIDCNKPVPSNRLKVAMSVMFFLFILLIIRLFYLQFIEGSNLKEMAYTQQTLSTTITPKRGTIYDASGKVLATSVSVDTISINPKQISDANKEKIAQAFSDIFDLDYEEVLQKVNSDSYFQTIIKKVEQDKVDTLKAWMEENEISSGINIDEDSKRYYPYSNLASQLIGFTGTDNQGLAGLELKWDDILTGTSGKIVRVTDVNSQEISSDTQQYIEAENGSDLYLTIDVNIQSIVEKYLKQAVEENSASYGTAIMMNPETGDILSMATYPDYNLNEPFEPNDSLLDGWNDLTSSEQSAKLAEMWVNKNVSSTYEPGSTFKLLMASIALEEDITEVDIAGDFYCTGSEDINGTKIRCWKNSHGSETLKQALANSCNPAFMQLGKRIGIEKLYKYFEAFGLFEKTGIETASEASSIFFDEDKVGPVELATMSFGQRFNITPIQLITAVSAIANDGILVQPRIVDKVVNTDTGAVLTSDVTEVRRVISSETAAAVREMMEYVVTNGTGKYGAVSGYSVGGKTGTSEPISGSDSGYTLSFIAISPVDDPKVVTLVCLYGMASDTSGSSIIGPVISQILSEVLPYLGIASDGSDSSNIETITVPNVTNKTVTEAENILKEAGFRVKTSITGDPNTLLVTEQTPKAGTSLQSDSIIILYTEENDVRTSVNVPDLRGMGLSNATSALKEKNLNISVEGRGTVISQSPSYTTSVEEGTVVKVVLAD